MTTNQRKFRIFCDVMAAVFAIALVWILFRASGIGHNSTELVAKTLSALTAVFVLLPRIFVWMWPSPLPEQVAEEISMACHRWKNQLLAHSPRMRNQIEESNSRGSIWKKMLENIPPVTEADLAHIGEVVGDASLRTINEFRDLAAQHSDQIPDEIRTKLISVRNVLQQHRTIHARVINGATPFSEGTYRYAIRDILGSLQKLDKKVH